VVFVPNQRMFGRRRGRRAGQNGKAVVDRTNVNVPYGKRRTTTENALKAILTHEVYPARLH